MDFLNEEVVKILQLNPDYSNRKIKELRESLDSTQKEVSNKVITSIFNDIKLYKSKLDFSFFDKTKGDVTKLENYDTILKTIKFLKQLASNVGNNTVLKYANEIETCKNNLISMRTSFQNAYRTNNKLATYLYGTTCLALITSCNYIIGESVEVIKQGSIDTCTVKKGVEISPSGNGNLDALIRFNQLCASNKLNQLFSKMDKKVKLEAVAIAPVFGAIIGFTMLALFVIREVVYIYYHTRVSLALYLENLAVFVEMNSRNVTDSNVKAKQEKTAQKLHNLASKIAVDQKVANDRSRDKINDSNKKASRNKPSSEDEENKNSGNSELDDVLY